MKFIHHLNLIFSSLKKRGIFKTIKYSFTEFLFDKLNNINTSGTSKLSELSIKSVNVGEGVEYFPSNKVLLDIIFSFLHTENILNNSTLLDYGSGKGRVLCYANKYPLKKIIGVEFSTELFDTSKENIENIDTEKISVINIDATEYKIPSDVNIFYLYNPFIGKVMEKVIENIKDHASTTKPNYIIYVNPVCRSKFLIRDGFKIIFENKNEFVIYRVDDKGVL